jgi:hypothetical protein
MPFGTNPLAAGNAGHVFLFVIARDWAGVSDLDR